MFLVYTHAFTANMYKFVFLFVFSVTYNVSGDRRRHLVLLTWRSLAAGHYMWITVATDDAT